MMLSHPQTSTGSSFKGTWVDFENSLSQNTIFFYYYFSACLLCLEEELRLLKTSPLHPPIYILNIFISTPAKKKRNRRWQECIVLASWLFFNLMYKWHFSFFSNTGETKICAGKFITKGKTTFEVYHNWTIYFAQEKRVGYQCKTCCQPPNWCYSILLQ